jgi:N-methylhydantoinase A
MDMRYLGQVHECTIAVPDGSIESSSLPAIEELFHEKHEALYTYAEREGGICELINLALTVRGKVTPVSVPELAINGSDPAAAKRDDRAVYFSESGGYIDTPVYDGTRARAGQMFAGPAIVEEPTTTIVVFPDSSMTLDRRGFYVMAVGQ